MIFSVAEKENRVYKWKIQNLWEIMMDIMYKVMITNLLVEATEQKPCSPLCLG